MEAKLYRLVATEGLVEPRRVKLLTKASVGERDDFLWGEVDTPFLVNDHETKLVLLATRHYGFSLEDLDQLPLDVYICCANDPQLGLSERLRQDDVLIMAWALLLSPDDHRTDLTEIYESLKLVRGNVFQVNPVCR